MIIIIPIHVNLPHIRSTSNSSPDWRNISTPCLLFPRLPGLDPVRISSFCTFIRRTLTIKLFHLQFCCSLFPFPVWARSIKNSIITVFDHDSHGLTTTAL